MGGEGKPTVQAQYTRAAEFARTSNFVRIRPIFAKYPAEEMGRNLLLDVETAVNYAKIRPESRIGRRKGR